MKQKKIAIWICLVGIFILALGFIAFEEKTFPSKENSALNEPIFEKQSGFYNSEFTIKISTKTPETKVFYTLDGSEPNRFSKVYTKPLKLKDLLFFQQFEQDISQIPTALIWKKNQPKPFRGICIKAKNFHSEKGFSQTITRNFFPEKKYALPVFFLSISPEKLFEAKKGIYVLGENYYSKKNLNQDRLSLPPWHYFKLPANYHQRGKKWRKNAQLECMMPSGEIAFSRNVEVKLKGQATRALPQKSLMFNFKKENLPYDLYKNNSETVFNSILLRTSGGDWLHTMIRDAFFQSMMQNCDLDLQAYRPVVLFVNGVYWGIHNLRSRWSRENIALRYGVKNEQVAFLEVGNDIAKGKDSLANLAFQNIIDSIKNYPKEKNYFKFISRNFNINNLIDYLILQTYSANTDWPNNNVKLLKIQDSTKWRFIVYDTDYGFGGSGKGNEARFDMENYLKNHETFLGHLYKNLSNNKTFAEMYRKRKEFLLENDLSEKQLLQNLENLAKGIEQELPEHINRWGFPESMQKWRSNLDTIRNFILIKN